MLDSEAVTSLFHLLSEQFNNKLPTVTMNKAALVDLSHVLEDVVINNFLPALVLTGFQKSHHWEKEAARYLQLIGINNTICVFAEGKFKDGGNKHILVPLQKGDELRQEWFLIVITEHFCCILCGLDNQDQVEVEAERTFTTFLSFEPAHIELAMDLLEEVLKVRNPAKLLQLQAGRKRFKLVAPQPYYINTLMGRFAEHLLVYQAVTRKLAREQAIRSSVSSFIHETSQPLTAALLTLDVFDNIGEIAPEDIELLKSSVNDLKTRIDRIRAVIHSQTPVSFSDDNKMISLIKPDS